MSVVLRFFKGKKGDIISRLPNGKIVLVHKSSPIKPKPMEIWLCEVREFERFAVATPISKEITVEQRFACGHVASETRELTDFDVGKIFSEPKVVEKFDVAVCDECFAKETREDEGFEITVNEEWKKKNEEFKRLKEEIETLKKEIVEKVTGKTDWLEARVTEDEVIVTVVGDARIFTKAGNFGIVQRTVDEVFEKRFRIPETLKEEVQKLRELEEKAEELEWWLIENRPVE